MCYDYAYLQEVLILPDTGSGCSARRFYTRCWSHFDTVVCIIIIIIIIIVTASALWLVIFCVIAKFLSTVIDAFYIFPTPLLHCLVTLGMLEILQSFCKGKV